MQLFSVTSSDLPPSPCSSVCKEVFIEDLPWKSTVPIMIIVAVTVLIPAGALGVLTVNRPSLILCRAVASQTPQGVSPSASF